MFESFLKPTITSRTITGDVCTFTSPGILPLASHVVDVTATQSGSGTPSPDNVRPINGYSAINISQSGADTSTPTVHTINLSGTYYGGEYDARTGVFTVTHKLVNVADLDIQISATGIFYAVLDDGLSPIVSNDIKSNILQWGGTSRTWIEDKTYAIAPWTSADTKRRRN